MYWDKPSKCVDARTHPDGHWLKSVKTSNKYKTAEYYSTVQVQAPIIL